PLGRSLRKNHRSNRLSGRAWPTIVAHTFSASDVTFTASVNQPGFTGIGVLLPSDHRTVVVISSSVTSPLGELNSTVSTASGSEQTALHFGLDSTCSLRADGFFASSAVGRGLSLSWLIA